MATPTFSKNKFRIENMDRLRRKLRRTDEEVRTDIRKEVGNLARLTRDYARGYAAPTSSNIAGAISDRIEKDGMGAAVGILSGAARRRAWYAHFVEWGTRPSRKTRHPGVPKRPFLFPAWEQAKAEEGHRVRAALNSAIQRICNGK